MFWLERSGPADILHHIHFALAAGNVSQLTGSHSSTIVDRIFQTLITSATFV